MDASADDVEALALDGGAYVAPWPAGGVRASLVIADGRATLTTSDGATYALGAASYRATPLGLDGVLAERVFYALAATAYGEQSLPADVPGRVATARAVVTHVPGHAPSSLALAPNEHVRALDTLSIMPVRHVRALLRDTPGPYASDGVLYVHDTAPDAWTRVRDAAARVALGFLSDAMNDA